MTHRRTVQKTLILKRVSVRYVPGMCLSRAPSRASCLDFFLSPLAQMRSLEAELATTELRAKDAERESKSLRATIESGTREVSSVFRRVSFR